MTIKQQGGIFGRNPTFNDVTVDGTLTVNGEPISDSGTMAQQDADAVAITGGTAALTSTTGTTFTTNQTSATNTNAAVFEFSGGNVGSNNPATALMKLKNSSNLRPAFSVEDKDGNYNVWIRSNGNINFSAGAGLDFSATSGTGTSELFDDYEEGTWTPTLNAYNGTPTVSGYYVKIGQMVYVECSIELDGTSDASNYIIDGLPFSMLSPQLGGGAVNTNTGGVADVLIGSDASSRLRLRDSSNANHSYTDIGVSSTVTLNAQYRAA